MIPNAYATQSRYKELSIPIIIIAGQEDQLVDIESQSARLHRELPHSELRRISRTGHMVHQTATEAVMGAINEAAEASGDHGRIPARPSIPEMIGG
jgi:pimeloyl-ACP methyl ester carboxylesterase